jgi:hypothetical protein
MTTDPINLDALDPAVLLVLALVAWAGLGIVAWRERVSSARDSVIEQEAER